MTIADTCKCCGHEKPIRRTTVAQTCDACGYVVDFPHELFVTSKVLKLVEESEDDDATPAMTYYSDAWLEKLIEANVGQRLRPVQAREQLLLKQVQLLAKALLANVRPSVFDDNLTQIVLEHTSP